MSKRFPLAPMMSRSFRFPTPAQLLRLPRVLSFRERLILGAGILAIVIGAVLMTTSWYLRATELRPAIGGTYIEGLLGEPRFVNPLFASANDVDRDLSRLLFSGLFRTGRDGTIEPDLAERYELSDDGKRVTVTLRENLRWHDGAEMTSDDVLFTVHLIQDPTAASPLRGSFSGVTVDRIDDRTVQFTIERPLAVFLTALTIGILPEHLWIDVPPSHLPLAELNLRPIGSGSYRFVGLTKDRRGSIRSYTLARSPNGIEAPPLLERLTFRFFTDQAQLLSAFNSREIDGIGTLMPIAQEALTRRDAVRYDVQLPQTTAVFFNRKRNERLAELAVREALSRAIDRHAIIDEAFSGAGQPIGGPLIPTFSPIADPPTPDAFDPAAAAALLDEKQWARIDATAYLEARTSATLKELRTKKEGEGEKGDDLNPTDEERAAIETRIHEEVDPDQSYYRMKSGSILSLTLTTADAPELIATAERIRASWRAIGVRTTIDVVSLERLRGDKIPSRDYDALLFSQILGPDPDPFPFWHSSQVRHPGLNLSYFSNRQIDTALEEARATLDHDTRGMRYAEFQELLTAERPAIFLSTPTLIYVMTNAVRGVTIDRLTEPADRFASAAEWYTETDRVWR